MEKIKIFYAADLHGDFSSLKAVKDYLKKTEFDVTLIAGDILDLPFSEKEIEVYLKPRKKGQEVVQDFAEKKKDLVTKIAEQHEVTPELIEKTVSPEMFGKIQQDQITLMELYALRDNAEIPLDSGIRGSIVEYSKAREKMNELQKNFEEHEKKYIGIAEKNMKKSYQEFKKSLSGVEYLTLPGNHDGNCLEEILKEESLHKKTKEIKGVKLAGYGGAAVIMPIVPSTFVQFSEGYIEQEGQQVQVAEAELFFAKEKPDIVLLHEVPAGAIPKIGHDRLANYVAQMKPALVLSAHIHEFHGAYQFQTNDKSILVMPGKLGKTEDDDYSKRYNNLRTFAEIEATKDKDGLTVDKVTIKTLTDKNKIETLSEYHP